MGSREAPYDKHKECDNCGKMGAHDFMGDYFCDNCVISYPDSDSVIQLDCEGIDISATEPDNVMIPKGKINTVAIEDIIPYMNETPITEQSFIDCKFERVDVSAEESGDESFHYYTYDFGTTYDPSLISAKNFTGVQLFNEEYKTWYTEGELQMLFMLFLKEEE